MAFAKQMTKEGLKGFTGRVAMMPNQIYNLIYFHQFASMAGVNLYDCLCFRMGLVIDVHEMRDVDMRVDLRRADIRMPKKLLYRADVRAVL